MELAEAALDSSGAGCVRLLASGVQIRIMNARSPDQVTSFRSAWLGPRRCGCERALRYVGGEPIRRLGLPHSTTTICWTGTYTVEAFVGRRQVGQTTAGQTNTFEVVRISDQEFLEGVSGEVTVQDFPFTGDTTCLSGTSRPRTSRSWIPSRPKIPPDPPSKGGDCGCWGRSRGLPSLLPLL